MNSPAARRPVVLTAWLVTAGFAWFWAWRHLALEWRANAQYHYGFGVPVLFTLIAWQRRNGPLQPASPGTVALLAAAGWLVFGCGEILRMHDPLWRLSGGLLVAGAVVLSAAGCLALGGRPLLRREAFALGFALLALPWPMPLEKLVVGGLLTLLTTVVTGLLNTAGLPALQHGNFIEVRAGWIGMEEACSGVESLQAGLMTAIFLGEFFHATPRARALLAAASMVLMAIGNFLRVLGLALVTAHFGAETAAAWHDWIGWAATIAAFGGLALVARHCQTPPPRHQEAVQPAGPVPPGNALVGTCCAVACLVTPLAVRTLFGPLQEAAPSNQPALTLRIDEPPAGWVVRMEPPAERHRALLRFSNGHSIRVHTPTGLHARVLHFFWRPGTTMPLFAHLHTPALCLPAAGWTPVGDPTPLELLVHGQRVSCIAWQFARESSARLLAIQALFCNGRSYRAPAATTGASRLRRILATREGRRRAALNEELLLYLSAPGDHAQQCRDAEEILETIFAEDIATRPVAGDHASQTGR